MEFKGNELFASGLKDDLREPEFIECLSSLGIVKMPNTFFLRSGNGYFKGTATMHFPSHEEAKAFKDKVNYKLIKGKTIWLTPYLLDKSFKDKKNEKCNLFVKLPTTMKPETLEALLSKYGEVFSIRIKYDKDNISQGYGYVCYASPKFAEEALKAAVKGLEVDGGKVTLFEFKPFNDRNPEGLKKNNLLIKNIDTQWSDADLKAFVSKLGDVTSVKVAKAKETDATNKGFGFACFKTVELAEKALKEIKNTKVGDKQLDAAYHLKKEERKTQLQKERLLRYKDKNIFVKNLPSSVNDAEFVKACSEFGKVLSARVFVDRVKDQNTNELVSVSKGFGFVCFEKIEDAKTFIDEVMTKGKKLWNVSLYAAIAESKKDRRKKLGMKTRRMGPPMFPMPMPMQRPPPFMWDPYMPMPMPPMMMERQAMMPPQYPMMPMPMPMAKTKGEYESMDRNQLGELIYERVAMRGVSSEVAGKITGMILEMEPKSIADLLVNQNEMDATFREAMKALGVKGDK
jgi:RNA recognition motif-containing protein